MITARITGVIVEACVESVDEAVVAERAGANRLELCANLAVGGTTPRAALLVEVKRRVRIPVAAMIRPRGGAFVYSDAELEMMRRDIDTARELGADLLVLGVLDDSAEVDAARTRELVARAQGTPVTFHRAFDEVRDLPAALDSLIGAGVARVLTGGGPGTALQGADMLARLVDRGGNRITILAGGTIRGHNVREVVRRSGVTEVHARSELDVSRIRDIVAATAEPLSTAPEFRAGPPAHRESP